MSPRARAANCSAAMRGSGTASEPASAARRRKPSSCAFVRRKIRTQRRSGLPRENPLVFYPRRVWEIADTHVRLVAFYLFLHRIRKKVECDARPYHDPALLPVETAPGKPAGMPRLKAAAA